MSEFLTDALKSSVYHHKLKGCKIAYFGFPRRIRKQKTVAKKVVDFYITEWVAKAKCKTHNAILCYAEKMCYWEIGGHFSQIEKGYKIAQKRL